MYAERDAQLDIGGSAGAYMIKTRSYWRRRHAAQEQAIQEAQATQMEERARIAEAALGGPANPDYPGAAVSREGWSAEAALRGLFYFLESIP